MEYPKCQYHKSKEAVVVHSLEAEKALGAGWFNDPACKVPNRFTKDSKEVSKDAAPSDGKAVSAR